MRDRHAQVRFEPASSFLDVRGSPEGAKVSLWSGAFARELASRVPQAERDALEASRGELVHLRLTSGLTPKQERDLENVEWKLDQLEMAEGAETLEMLKTAAAVYRNLGRRIDLVVKGG